MKTKGEIALEMMAEYALGRISDSEHSEKFLKRALLRAQNIQTIPGYRAILARKDSGEFSPEEIDYIVENAKQAETQAMAALRLKKQIH